MEDDFLRSLFGCELGNIDVTSASISDKFPFEAISEGRVEPKQE